MNQTALENDHEQNVFSAVNEEEIHEEKNEETPLCSICLQGIGEFEFGLLYWSLKYSWDDIIFLHQSSHHSVRIDSFS